MGARTRFNNFSWTAENTAALLRMADEGYTAAQAASELGCTKNAAVGKAMRLGHHFDSAHPNNTRTKTAGLRAAGALKVKPAPRNPVGNHKTAPNRPIPVDLSHLDQATVTTTQLRAHHCRWPVGDPKADDFGYCGAQVKPDKPYCSAHCERAYVETSAPKKFIRSIRRWAA